MPLADWFRKSGKPRLQPGGARKNIPEGLWSKCPSCQDIVYHKDLQANLQVCPSCGYHHRLGAHDRVSVTVDDGTFEEMDLGMTSMDPLKFKAKKPYSDSLAAARLATGTHEAVVTGVAGIGGHKVALGVMDFRFVGGSMGSVVGEKITRLAERAIQEKLPLLVFSASGGARMQEGMYSLMQMAKTSAALGRYQRISKPFLSVLTNPTMGGVTASFATLADVILAEPNALIGFAGPRVIEQTVRERLPKDFQTAEFMREHGLVDVIVPRTDMKQTIINVLGYLDSGEAHGKQTHY